MNNRCHIVASLFAVDLTSIYNDSSGHRPDIIKDKNGNAFTIESLPNNKIWMTGNLKINIRDHIWLKKCVDYCGL